MALRAKKPPWPDDAIVVATKTLAYSGGVIHVNERYRASDQAVRENWTAFVPEDVLEHERPNFWDTVPLTEHKPHVHIPEQTIPPHRMVRAVVDRWQQSPWAPGSDGERHGGAQPFGSVVTQIGVVYDALDERVLAHPEEFVWVERPVTEQDLERLARLESEEPGDAA